MYLLCTYVHVYLYLILYGWIGKSISLSLYIYILCTYVRVYLYLTKWVTSARSGPKPTQSALLSAPKRIWGTGGGAEWVCGLLGWSTETKKEGSENIDAIVLLERRQCGI